MQGTPLLALLLRWPLTLAWEEDEDLATAEAAEVLMATVGNAPRSRGAGGEDPLRLNRLDEGIKVDARCEADVDQEVVRHVARDLADDAGDEAVPGSVCRCEPMLAGDRDDRGAGR